MGNIKTPRRLLILKARAIKLCLEGVLLCFIDTTIAEMVNELTDPEESRERIQVEQGACFQTALLQTGSLITNPARITDVCLSSNSE